MGLYIETGFSHGKADAILAKYPSAKELPFPQYLSGELITVCVINNGPFEAAGVCFSKDEFEAFCDPSDHRMKCWLAMRVEDVRTECPKLDLYLRPQRKPS